MAFIEFLPPQNSVALAAALCNLAKMGSFMQFALLALGIIGGMRLAHVEEARMVVECSVLGRHHGMLRLRLAVSPPLPLVLDANATVVAQDGDRARGEKQNHHRVL